MHLALDIDDFGRLVCKVSDTRGEVEITAGDPGQATADLLDAVEDVVSGDCGECYWPEETREHRWLFRRNGDKVQVVILRSAGVMTGWEHVFWTAADLQSLVGEVRSALDRMRLPV